MLQADKHTGEPHKKCGMAELQGGIKTGHDQQPYQQQHKRREIIAARLAGMRRKHRENGGSAGQRGNSQKHRPDGQSTQNGGGHQKGPRQKGIDKNDVRIGIGRIAPPVQHGSDHQIVIGLISNPGNTPGKNQQNDIKPYRMKQGQKRYPSPNLFHHKQIP